MKQRDNRRARAFTLIELMTVLGIIVVLISILIPTVSKVRKSAQVAAVKQQLSALVQAVERYQTEFRAYPGPLSNDQIGVPIPTPAVKDQASGSNLGNITMAENLVLGLLGGLKLDTSTAVPEVVFDYTLVGKGPASLNRSTPKATPAFYDAKPLSWADGQPSGGTDGPGPLSGEYKDDAGDATDSAIPEFVDSFPNPMPFLYLRARRGAAGVASYNGNYQYDLNQIIGYTAPSGNGSIGVGKKFSTDDYVPASTGALRHGLNAAVSPPVNPDDSLNKGDPGYKYPYTIFPYLNSPTIAPTDKTSSAAKNATGTPRQKDGFILISAGLDRVYGTSDDICSFGEVTE